MNKRNILYLLSALLIASMVLTACGGTDSGNNAAADSNTAENNTASDTANDAANDAANDTASDDAAPAPADYPFKNENVYVAASIGEPETLDPAWTYETAGSAIETNVYEGLVWFERERNDVFVPLLATSWETNDAGDVWTFHIREGVTFHEGGTLEPHDVAYSLQRAMMQDRSSGPHWMTHEVFFGTYSMLGGTVDKYFAGVLEAEGFDADAEGAVAREMTDADYVGACEYVKAAIVADDAAGTVTYTLDTPAPWFTAILANIFAGATYDQEWMTEQGAWNGSCDTWRDYNDPSAQDTVLFNTGNGTGPYMLDHWTPGEEIVLVANQNYWRAEGDLIWEGGPSGVASIDRFVLLSVDEWGTRLAMFQAGDADYVYAPAQYNSQVEDFYGTVDCALPDHSSCVGAAEGGFIQAYVGLQSAAMTPIHLNQHINEEGGNSFMGSGKLDGNGIPADFFSDVHIRRAFSYCFDYETLITEGLDGAGAQAQGPIIQGMLGYRDDGFVYEYDLEKCAEEFQLADSDVWGQGFYIQATYNTGNDTRRLAAEILKAGLEEVNPDFIIQVVGLPWPVLLSTSRTSKLPLYIGGWLEDFHDPHNWVHPFLHSTGAYSRNVNMADADAAVFDDMITAGATASGADARRPIYEELQLLAQTDAIMIWMYQGMGRNHFSPWIQGYYYNAAYSASAYSYIYALDKVGP